VDLDPAACVLELVEEEMELMGGLCVTGGSSESKLQRSPLRSSVAVIVRGDRPPAAGGGYGADLAVPGADEPSPP
jgi:hypothetical protein